MKQLLLTIFLMTTLSTAVLAQDSAASQKPDAAQPGYSHDGDYGRRAEVFVTGFGLFPSQSSGNGIDADGTKAGGGSAGYRFSLNGSSALEGRYGFSRNSQKYTSGSAVSSIPVYLSEISGSYVYAFAKSRRNQFFVEGGGGLVLFSPGNYGGGTVTVTDPVYGGSSYSSGLDRQGKGMFLYGAGADMPVSSHVSLRFEFRGLGYKTPDFGLAPLQTNAFSFTYEPSAGIAFRF